MDSTNLELTSPDSIARPFEAGASLLGQTVADRYRIEGRLGRGGRGAVYRARDEILERDVALKVLRRLADAEAAERFQREAQLVARLEHPHIVPLFDFGRWRSLPFFTMPVVEGSSLRALYRRRAPGRKDVLEIGAQLAEALEFSHVRGIVHQDLKPENVLVTWPDGRPHAHLLDFGIAFEIGEEPLARGEVVGTFAYTSPERLTGGASGASCDLWSLGVLLFEGLAGHRPFRARRPLQLCLEVTTVAAPPLEVEGIGPEVARLVGQCLERAIGARPSSAAEVARRLRSTLAGERAEQRSTRAPESDARALEERAARLLIHSDYDGAEAAYEAARKANDTSAGDAGLAADAEAQLARLAMRLGRSREALARCAEAARLADGDPPRRAGVAALAALVLVGIDRLEEAAEELERGYEQLGRAASEASGDGARRKDASDTRRFQARARAAEVSLLRADGNLWLARGEPGRALRPFLAAIERLETSVSPSGAGSPLDRWELSIALYNGAEAHQRLGDADRAEELLDRAQALKSSLGDRWGLAYLHALRADLLLDAGRVAGAAREATIAAAIAAELGDTRVDARAHLARCRVAWWAGQTEEARRLARVALDRAEAGGWRSEARAALTAIRRMASGRWMPPPGKPAAGT